MRKRLEESSRIGKRSSNRTSRSTAGRAAYMANSSGAKGLGVNDSKLIPEICGNQIDQNELSCIRPDNQAHGDPANFVWVKYAGVHVGVADREPRALGCISLVEAQKVGIAL